MILSLLTGLAHAACNTTEAIGDECGQHPDIDKCECNMKVVVPHATVFPGGFVDMEVRISLVDSAINFPCTYEIKEVVPPGEMNPEHLVREGGPPGSPPTTTNDLVVGTPSVNPVVVYGLSGTSSSFIRVTAPANVDASRDTTASPPWNHVYEMSVTVEAVQPAVGSGFDTCVINYRQPGTTKSEYGTSVPVDLRT